MVSKDVQMLSAKQLVDVYTIILRVTLKVFYCLISNNYLIY